MNQIWVPIIAFVGAIIITPIALAIYFLIEYLMKRRKRDDMSTQ